MPSKVQCWVLAFRDRIWNNESRRRTGVSDVIETAARNKWRWAGHVAKDDGKWSNATPQWSPRKTKKKSGDHR